MKTIIVGVDGSRESQDALRWAVEEARVHGAQLRAVYAYEYTPAWSMYSYSSDAVPAPDVPPAAGRAAAGEATAGEEARSRAEGLLRNVIAAVDTRGVHVEPVAVEDRRPARALVEHSRDADLLVVGSRGRGGFTGLLLGSVSQKLALHALCPVVIIRPGQSQADGT